MGLWCGALSILGHQKPPLEQRDEGVLNGEVQGRYGHDCVLEELMWHLAECSEYFNI